MVVPLLAALVFAAGPMDGVAPEDRSGPSRAARCRIDREPVRRCRFTPLFGDGSFNLELAPNRQLRLVIGGEEGLLFIPITPTKRVPMAASYRRDRVDRACWVAGRARDQGTAGPPDRICVYR